MSEGLVLNGRFRLLEQLGCGGMGTVWRAEDMELEAEAAVKLIDPALLKTSMALKRFKREAKAAAAIRSTHVVQILEYGVQQTEGAEPTPYIAMELLRGETLATRLERVSRLTPEEALPILTHVARALSLAHDSGIVHRDLKPDNVFLVREMGEDVGKVLDFGIARQLSAFARPGGLQTESGTILGTPYYMSPEQTAGKAVDHRADIWAFAVIAYECLLGVRPFDSDTLGGLFYAICVTPSPVPSMHGPVPDGFDEWFARATARAIEDRFQSMQESFGALRRIFGRTSARWLTSSSALSGPQTGATIDVCIGNSGPTPPPASQTVVMVRSRRHWLNLALGTSALVLVGLGGFFSWRRISATNSDTVQSLFTSQAFPPPTVGVTAPRVSSSEPNQDTPPVSATSDLAAVAASALPLVSQAGSPRMQSLSGPGRATSGKKSDRSASSPLKRRENVAGF